MNTYETTYGKPCSLDVKVPAEMLESVAGFGSERFTKELAFGLEAADLDNPDSLLWLCALLDRKLMLDG